MAVERYESLNGAEKAAILMLSVGEDSAAKLFSMLDIEEVMAEIFNYFDRATEGRFMAALEERHKEAADRIKALMFTFEDLSRLDGQGIQALLRSAGNDRIAVALKGASERLRDLFFANMSERAAEILQDEMQTSLSTETAVLAPAFAAGPEGLWRSREARPASPRPPRNVVWLELAPLPD